MEDEGVCDEITALEIKHKKEKKELLAQVQALKRIAKNDKTKKKDITEQIMRLEIEQDLRHTQELESVQKKLNPEPPDSAVEQVESELPKLKLSKAQKRRDKKHKQEMERYEQIKLQEKENLSGPRNVEVQEIGRRLKKRNLKIFTIPSDGDCLYKAVAHQLESVKQKVLSVEELRQGVSEYMKNNKDDFIPFMTHPETLEMITDSEFDSYCEKISSTKVWGGQLEIKALSGSLKCPISVIQATGPDSIEQGSEFDGPPLIITYHRHMYRLGEHYNSTTIFVEVEN